MPEPQSHMKEFILSGRGPNTMTIESLGTLVRFLEQNAEAPILIFGENNAFSAGLDIDALIQGDPRQVSDAIEQAAEKVFLHPAPVVAAVNGHAIAGGCLLLQACDLRLCDPDARIRIGMPGVALGINYPPKLMRILQYRIPRHSIDRVLLEADNHAPAQALALGLVDELADDVIASARERLKKLAGYPAQAYREAKLTLRRAVLDIPEAERKHFDAQFRQHWGADSLRTHRRDK